MKAIFAIIALACANHFLPFSTILGKNCDPSLTAFTVTELTVNPWPPVRSGNVTAKLSGRFNEAVALGGYLSYFSVDWVPLIHKHFPANGTFAAGETYSDSVSGIVAPNLPSGNYDIKTYLLDNRENRLSCWELDFTL